MLEIKIVVGKGDIIAECNNINGTTTENEILCAIATMERLKLEMLKNIGNAMSVIKKA